MKRTIEFFGKQYPLESVRKRHCDESPVFICKSDRKSVWYLSVPRGPLSDFNVWSRGRTFQKAAENLEVLVLEKFKKTAEFLDYEVTNKVAKPTPV